MSEHRLYRRSKKEFKREPNVLEKGNKIFSKTGRGLKILPKLMKNIYDLRDNFYHYNYSIEKKDLLEFRLPNIDLS